MRKNGFTLIELLAVIVILAIIALIATPIILGIINDAREESNERSVELYASAVRNAIAAYQLTGTSAPIAFEDLNVQYDGKVECTVQELYEDGSFYLEGCKVNESEKEYSYGTKQVTQVYKPQYYAYTGLYGTVGETAAPANPSSVPPTGKNVYLGYDVTDDIVSAAYTCFTRKDTEYCLKGDDPEVFDTNKDVLLEAFGESACSVGDGRFDCDADGLDVHLFSDGDVLASDGGSVDCNVYSDGLIEFNIY